ncbi:ATP-binding cassette domain-containing protein [Amycolatopsis sp. A1MSW2902]|uniref:ATP-binding cassette domain-containing protein n=1 Tax=Amycolatopsis sp. A1MSW2902 TaxID=687413 RepID=UPI00307E0D77
MVAEMSSPGSIRVNGRARPSRSGTSPRWAGLDLRVEAGRVCALLGGNGAGKTTLVRILTTPTAKDAGIVRVNGWDVDHDPARVRASIGVVGQYAALDEVLSASENLKLFARLIGLSRGQARTRTDELLEQAGLSEHADQAERARRPEGVRVLGRYAVPPGPGDLDDHPPIDLAH